MPLIPYHQKHWQKQPSFSSYIFINFNQYFLFLLLFSILKELRFSKPRIDLFLIGENFDEGVKNLYMINLEFYKVFLCLSKFLETDFCIGGLRVEISLFK